ncbi:unnamed protein product [Orchesella dallaii]|uniref:F-box domain-containing protein n=1 Tax=Orchesella dallaii TaxID=48710 RepID=A0ABP1PMV6_9HEXA
MDGDKQIPVVQPEISLAQSVIMDGDGDKQIPVLQPEIWNRILLNFWGSEENLEHLLTCRLVCRSWEELVDKMPPNRAWKYWNPWLRYIGNYGIFDSTLATSFQSDSDISNFLTKLAVEEAASKESESSLKKTPFPNQTVRLFKAGYDIKTETENLLKIIQENGQFIKMLLFKPNRDLPESLTDLPQLLSHMGNLETLMFDSRALMDEQWKLIKAQDFPSHLTNLRELVLLGEFGYRAIITRTIDNDTMYAKFSVIYGPQIKSITFTVLCMDLSDSNVLTRFPNLEELKFECLHIPTSSRFEDVEAPWPKLKRLALGVTVEENPDSEAFKFILKFVAQFAETLESLSLKFNRSPYSDNDNVRDMRCLALDAQRQRISTTFPKLKQFILPLRSVTGGGIRTLENRFSCDLPELKSFLLEDMQDQFKNREVSQEEMERICQPIWPLVPPSVETISIRAVRLNRVLQREFPVLYSCHRDEGI